MKSKLLPLAEYVTTIPALQAKGYVQPLHLKPLLDELEKIQRGEQVQVVCHTPPRGAKTESLLSSIPWLLEQHPDWELGYTSYNATQARSKAVRAREWAKSKGIEVVRDTVIEWRTPQGGGCIARGVGEGITGQGLDVVYVDDPVKDRAEAESELKRERVWDWFNEALYTRRNPGKRPRSIIVNMARWHPDDLAGRLIKAGWKYICLPAITETNIDGAMVKSSFWPEGWSVDQLEATRAQLGEYSFASLYQGAPRPRGGSVFGDPWVYSALPKTYRPGMGLDLAYSKKTSADWSVIVVMGLFEGHFYVLDVYVTQERAPQFLETVKRFRRKYPGARMRWYGSGIETEGIASFMKPALPQLEAINVSADKFIRAQAYAAAWNAGKVLLPPGSDDVEDAPRVPWLDRFVDEHVNFTGVNDLRDDIVDASVAAYDVLATVRENRDEDKESIAPRRM